MEIREVTEIRNFIPGRAFARAGYAPYKKGVDFAMDEVEGVAANHGIGCTRRAERQIAMGLMEDFAMDSIQQPVTTPSITNPVQFYQNFLAGIIEVQTNARKADEIVGIANGGQWSDEQIVQQIVENAGAAVPYGDTTNVPYTEWNQNFTTRTVVRYEQGLRVGVLEEDRAARARMNSGAQKRRSAGIQLEIARNQVAFYGYNNGANLTYGLLNDPNLPGYTAVAGAGWDTATFLVMTGQLITAFQTVRTQTGEIVDPDTMQMVLTVPTNRIDFLRKTTDFGISVLDWLRKAYPNTRIVSCPQYNAANGGQNVFTLHAESVPDSGTDDGRTFIQIVPAKFQLLGISKGAKFYEEDYSNATAGVFCKRPYAVTRWTNI